MYNLTLINATNPQILIKTTSEVLVNGMLEETLLFFLLILIFTVFYSTSYEVNKALVRSTFSVMILALISMGLDWINGYFFFLFVVAYALSLFMAKIAN